MARGPESRADTRPDARPVGGAQGPPKGPPAFKPAMPQFMSAERLEKRAAGGAKTNKMAGGLMAVKDKIGDKAFGGIGAFLSHF